MTKEEHIRYWVESANRDMQVVEYVFSGGYYVWALFMGHLVVEKLLKAYYVKMVSDDVPYTHNLLKLAKRSGLELTEKQEAFLDEVTDFNIQGRYPDHKDRFYKLATSEFTAKHLNAIKEFRQWLLQKISE